MFTRSVSRIIILVVIFAMLAINLSFAARTTQAQSNAQRSAVDWEEKYRALPRTDLLRDYMKVLSAEPHNIGSLASKRNAEWIRDKFKSWGLDAKIEEYDVLFPTPQERIIEMIAPEKYQAKLKEPAIPEDSDSSDANQLPTYNSYSGDGDVTAQLVYVNYGIPDDYEQLSKLGVDVKGKIVIARYGASWRGIKPKVAYEHGALGCIIYSDPKDDGYYKGDVYPQGPFRPEQGVQRGSVIDLPLRPGDPLTPNIGATKDAKRLARNEAETILKIPVLPISYSDALPLLKNLGGQVVPEAWRGALPITYHVGPGPATVRMKVTAEWKLHTLYNVIGRIEGSTFPDEWVIRGNHHDAWVNGAEDPISGLVSVLEEARSFGELLKQGWRPKRTILFAAWDGEEPGLLGSTEWVEHHAQELSQKAVAYINSDTNGRGTLDIAGSHSLERFMNDVGRVVAQPKSKQTVWEAIRAQRMKDAKSESDKRELRERSELRISALGSGSDYSAFLNHLGIASLNIGFDGESDGGIYHSIYDSFRWFTKYSDGDFEYTRALAQVAGIATMRLADASLLPFEFRNFAETADRYADQLNQLLAASKPTTAIDLSALQSAIARVQQQANNYDLALRTLITSGKTISELKVINQMLLQSERKLLSEAGLPRRPWFKHQIYAPGFYTGYGVKTMPGIREAIEQKRWAEASEQVQVLSKTLNAFADHLEAITRKLQNH